MNRLVHIVTAKPARGYGSRCKPSHNVAKKARDVWIKHLCQGLRAALWLLGLSRR